MLGREWGGRLEIVSFFTEVSKRSGPLLCGKKYPRALCSLLLISFTELNQVNAFDSICDQRWEGQKKK